MKKRIRLFGWLIPLVLVLGATVIARQTEPEPMMAPLNAEVSARDAAVILRNVFLYPNERSLYGPGESNYGMPVKLQYGKGPVVVLDLKKKPDRAEKFELGGLNPWLDVQIFSDGKPLSRSTTSSTGIYGFNFWVARMGDVESYELEKLGNVECLVRLSTIVKVCDLPVAIVERGSKPFFEDGDVRVWNVRWSEKPGYDGQPETQLEIGIDMKTNFVSLNAVFRGKEGGEDIQPTSMSVNEPSGAPDKAELSFSRSFPVSRLSGAELWKTVPVIEKRFPLRFVPQKTILRDGFSF
jgi:hypothetical protein